MNPNVGANNPPPVSILVPVYRNLEVTRKCLESIFLSDLPDNISLTVINDCSPEPDLDAYCRELESIARIRLVVNDSNLGFVRSANRGFELEPGADVLLLNSDTEVSHDWLQRLQACAYLQPDIGTVTPFSNNGTICSYPVFPQSNPLPAAWTAPELDTAFKTANSGMFHEIPTAVGFCMYIKRACLNETGLFDAENFGHGYGEECDFSLRANALGWRHVVAADVFVYHEGAASFISEAEARKRNADIIMNELHPQYHALVSGFIQSDPLHVFRRNVDAVRLHAKPEYSASILDEHLSYARRLLDRVDEVRHSLSREMQQRQLLQKMLQDCRDQFSSTDRALSEAQKVVDHLNDDLASAQLYAEQLREHIRKMEQSRSWRYTAWLRRK